MALQYFFNCNTGINLIRRELIDVFDAVIAAQRCVNDVVGVVLFGVDVLHVDVSVVVKTDFTIHPYHDVMKGLKRNVRTTIGAHVRATDAKQSVSGLRSCFTGSTRGQMWLERGEQGCGSTGFKKIRHPPPVTAGMPYSLRKRIRLVSAQRMHALQFMVGMVGYKQEPAHAFVFQSRYQVVNVRRVVLVLVLSMIVIHSNTSFT